MAQMLLVNPRRRKRRKTARRNPTKRRRKMTALQRQYFGGGRRKRRRSTAVAAAPRRRRRRAVAHRAAPVARRVHRRRRRSGIRAFAGNRSGKLSLNPSSLIKNTIMPAAVGAAGALGVDILWHMAPIPAQYKVGTIGALAKIGGAVLIGMGASKVLGQKMGAQVAGSAILVTLYDLGKGLLQAQFPTLPMSEYVSGMGYVQAGQFIPAGENMGEYVSGMIPQAGGFYAGQADEVF